MALQQLESSYLTCEDTSEYNHIFAARLIERGSNPDAIDTRTGNSFLHRAALESNEAAAMFLVHHGAITNHKNVNGETPIHIAAQNGLHRLVEVLLQNGADPNLQTALKPKPNPLALPSIPLSGAVASNQSTPTGSSTNLDGSTRVSSAIPPSVHPGNVIGEDILSPSTLGALNALNFASQVSVPLVKVTEYHHCVVGGILC